MANREVCFENRVARSFFFSLEVSPKDCLKKTENCFYRDEQWIFDFSRQSRALYSRAGEKGVQSLESWNVTKEQKTGNVSVIKDG